MIRSISTCSAVSSAEQADRHTIFSNELRFLPTGCILGRSESPVFQKRIAIKPCHQSDSGETNHLLYPATHECVDLSA